MSRRTATLSLLAVLLMAWFLRSANLSAVWSHIREVNAGLLLVSLVAIVASFVTRAVRWQYLLSPVGPTRFRTVFRTTVIGLGALGLLPVRVGDLIRPYLLARQEGLRVSSTLATVVMERVLDLIAVLVLMAVYVWGYAGGVGMPAPLLRSIEVSAALGTAAAAAMLIVMWILATHPERIGAFAAVVARVLPDRIGGRVEHLAVAFSSGFAAARDLRKLLLAVLWSFPLWMAIAAQVWAVTVAFGISIPYAGAFLLQALLVLGVAVPTPGGVGSFHEAYRIGVTTFFGAPNEPAVAAALVTHVIAFVPAVGLGLLFMAQDGLSIGGLQDMAGAVRQEEGGAG